MNRTTNRGMKKWAPFSALSEQSLYINKVKNRYQEKEIEICDDLIYQIEHILNNYHGEIVNIKYFNSGLKTIIGTIKKIDTINNTITIENKVIHIAAIKNIEVN